MEYCSAFKKEGNIAICNNLDELVLNEISQTDKENTM